MELIASINSAINGFVWGVPMLVLLVGGGILLTIRNRGVQFRKFGYAMKNTIGKIFKKGEAKEGEITPFQAMSTALAGTVGTGNLGRPWHHLLAVDYSSDWYGHQIFRGASGGEVPGKE